MKIILKDIRAFNEMLIRKGFSKSKLAGAAGVSPQMVNQISNGVRHPGPETAKRIADVLQVDWDGVFRIDYSSSVGVNGECTAYR